MRVAQLVLGVVFDTQVHIVEDTSGSPVAPRGVQMAGGNWAVLSPAEMGTPVHVQGGQHASREGMTRDEEPTSERRKGSESCLSLRVLHHPSPGRESSRAQNSPGKGGSSPGQPLPGDFEQQYVALPPSFRQLSMG